MPHLRPAIATLGIILLQTCGCVMNRQVVEGDSPRPFWEPKIRQVAQAEPEVVEAIDELSHASDTHVSFARWREEVGDLHAAREHYETALEESPEHLAALLGLAQMELRAGNTSAAEQHLTKAMQVDSESAVVSFTLGQLRSAQRRWDDAAEAFNQASLADPAQTAYRFHLAVALTHAGKVEMAIPNFIRTVGHAEAHYNVGRILHDKGLLEQAEQHFELAVAEGPELEEAHEWLNRTRLALRAAEGAGSGPSQQVGATDGHPIQTVGHLSPAT
jgi:tetratricopeptide (TPR) repeat protein